MIDLHRNKPSPDAPNGNPCDVGPKAFGLEWWCWRGAPRPCTVILRQVDSAASRFCGKSTTPILRRPAILIKFGDSATVLTFGSNQTCRATSNLSSERLNFSNSAHHDPSGTHTARLITAAQDGDTAALGELLELYRKYVVFLARTGLHHHMRGKADPSDLAQEVCLAAHGNIGDFRGTSAEEFAGWLRGILSNVLAMHVRRYLGTQKRDPRLEQKLHAGLASASGFLLSGIAGDVTSPSQHFARNEAFLQLAGALESLPDDYRQVIMLRHVEGWAFADVAKAMGRSVDSVEKLWVRGLARLKTAMGEV